MNRKPQTLRSEYAAQVALVDAASRSKYPARYFDGLRAHDDDRAAFFSIKTGDPDDASTWALSPL
jgi:hypothetical protein